MFLRWGAFVYRHRRIVALVALGVAALALPFASRASGELTSGGWLDPLSQSSQVESRLAAEFGGGKSSLLALFTSTQPGADATSAAFQGAIATATAPLRADPNVTGIVGYANTGDRRFVSLTGNAAYVVINLTVTDEASVPLYDALRAEIAPPAGYSVSVSGYAPFTIDTSRQAGQDLERAELVSLPIVAVVLFLVFTSAVAAGMPLLVAGLAIPTSLGLVYWVAQLTTMSIFVLNIASMLGLALAIDYSLFLVSRFREELARGREVGDAVAMAVATSGKAVVFSGIAVAIGLSGLMVFPFATIRSIGLGSALVVACSVF
ncbi:MAG: MMPL family transporter, partial [Thermoplasmata archaeon]|nr:MMPL family transporter [Thermoplasmata archaeon]